MTTEDLLPLFPLEVVLLPGVKLPLHIFEERYKLMVGDAVDQQSEFGIVLVTEGKVVSVGCTARVERVTRRYEDGRFDILAVGGRRFSTISLDESLAFLRAKVEYFEDASDDPADPKEMKKVVRLARQAARSLDISLPPQIELLQAQPSFQIAGALPLDLTFKQRLLGRRSEPERLAELADYLVQLIQRIEKVQRVQKLAQTNGRAKLAGGASPPGPVR